MVVTTKIADMASQYSLLVWAFLLQAMLSVTGEAQVAGDPISRKSTDAQEFTTSRNPNRLGTNGPGLAPEAKLSLADLRTLLHLYSRLDRPKMVEAVAGNILNRNPRDKETLQLLTSYYLEKKDAPRTLKHALALVRFYSDDAQAHFLLAMCYKLDGQHRLAKEVLAKMKSVKFNDKLFPYETELASAALLSGDWPQAIRSYQEALENPALQAEERRETRNQLEELYRTHLPQLSLKETYTQLESGLSFISVLEWSQPLVANHRLQLGLEWDDLKLNGTDLLRSQWVYNYDVLAAIQSNYRRWRTKIFGGIGNEGAVCGADLTRVLAPEANLTLALHHNQQAKDSLLLEVLHSREDELSLFWHTPLYAAISGNLKLEGRRVLVAGETLGYGYGVEANLERNVLKNVPELRLGYRGLITGFSQSSDNIRLVSDVAAPGTSTLDRLLILRNLISPINLHGLYLSWQQTINPEWSWHAVAGSDYSFTRSSFGHTFEAGLSYFANRRTELLLNAGYSTSASTSDLDSERLELSLAVRCRF